MVKALDDGEEYLEMRSAMGDVGFDAQLQEELVALAAAVLHISNVAGLSAKGAGSGGAALPIAAALLGVKDDALRGALTHRTIVTAGEAIRTPLSDGEAAATRDALAKALYSATFSAVVTEVNEAIKTDASHLTTGILDIYGFEIFGVNSFEQLCINYANEKLQQLFIELTVLSEQQEYAEEGIAWTPVPFFDNRVVCELIEGTKPAGVFAWLDEECVMPQGSDTTLYEKLAKNLVSHKHFAATTEKDLTKALFTITHYAGDVGYSPAGMLEKNRDTLFRDLHEMIAASAKPFVAQLLGPRPRQSHAEAAGDGGFQFRQQMGELVKVLGKCEPHYIRCIKPNDHKKSGSFDADRVRHQVRYLGLLENAQVRRAGFAYRQLHRVRHPVPAALVELLAEGVGRRAHRLRRHPPRARRERQRLPARASRSSSSATPPPSSASKRRAAAASATSRGSCRRGGARTRRASSSSSSARSRSGSSAGGSGGAARAPSTSSATTAAPARRWR